MSCHGRERGLGSEIGVRKQKEMVGRKEGTGSCQINRKEKGKTEGEVLPGEWRKGRDLR